MMVPIIKVRKGTATIPQPIFLARAPDRVDDAALAAGKGFLGIVMCLPAFYITRVLIDHKIN